MSNRTKIIYTHEVYTRFENEYFNLNKQGNLLQAFTNILSQVEAGIKNDHGEDLCLEDLIASYESYLVYWNRTFAQTDEKFISKDNKLMNPEVFITTRAYQTIWHSPTTSRDKYLFGNTTEEYRTDKLTEFTDGIPKIKKKTRRS